MGPKNRDCRSRKRWQLLKLLSHPRTSASSRWTRRLQSCPRLSSQCWALMTPARRLTPRRRPSHSRLWRATSWNLCSNTAHTTTRTRRPRRRRRTSGMPSLSRWTTTLCSPSFWPPTISTLRLCSISLARLWLTTSSSARHHKRFVADSTLRTTSRLRKRRKFVKRTLGAKNDEEIGFKNDEELNETLSCGGRLLLTQGGSFR